MTRSFRILVDADRYCRCPQVLLVSLFNLPGLYDLSFVLLVFLYSSGRSSCEDADWLNSRRSAGNWIHYSCASLSTDHAPVTHTELVFAERSAKLDSKEIAHNMAQNSSASSWVPVGWTNCRHNAAQQSCEWTWINVLLDLYTAMRAGMSWLCIPGFLMRMSAATSNNSCTSPRVHVNFRCCCSGYLEWNVQNEKCEVPFVFAFASACLHPLPLPFCKHSPVLCRSLLLPRLVHDLWFVE